MSVALTSAEREWLGDVWDEETTVSVSAFFPIVARIIAARLSPVRAVYLEAVHEGRTVSPLDLRDAIEGGEEGEE